MKYAPTVLVVHPEQETAQEIAGVLQEYRFHALPVSSAVDALEHVENLRFDLVLVSTEMPDELWDLLFHSTCGDWLGILLIGNPDESPFECLPLPCEIKELVLTVSEAVVHSVEMSYHVAEAWHAAWYGEAGEEIWPTETRRQPKPETYEELRARVLSLSEGSRAS